MDKNYQLYINVLDAHKGIIYKVANAYCKNEEDRKDLIQEISIQLWKSFDKYNDEYKYSTWIYRIALNVAISFYRKESTRTKQLNPFNDVILNIADVEWSESQDVNILHNFIAELKVLDKAIMLLYLEEKNYKEIAEIMGLSETNVATKINRIKSSLKQKFNNIQN